jgi:hypothetical protein
MVVPGATSGEQATIGKLGARPGATRLPLQISDQVSGSVDVGTGNLMLSVNGLSLPGVHADVPLGGACQVVCVSEAGCYRFR